MKRAVALNPDSADAHGWLAYAQMLSDASLPDARSSIERAMQLAPGRIEYRLRWADIRIQQGGYDDAKALLTQTPRPTPEEVKQGLAGYLCRCGTHTRILHAVLRAAKA